MATPHEKLADSQAVLSQLQKGRHRVLLSKDLTRVHHERLLRNGFLQEVMKEWLISAGPGVRAGAPKGSSRVIRSKPRSHWSIADPSDVLQQCLQGAVVFRSDIR